MRGFFRWFFFSAFLLLPAQAVDLYGTDFSTFTAGPDQIVGTDGWVGTHAGQDRSGILAEADHAIAGIGNAAYLGGNTTSITSGGNSVFVRKSYAYNPVPAGNEVITIRLLTGIKDSIGFTRDNFEVLIYNNNSLGGGPAGAFPLAGIQFDNSQINTLTGRPFQTVYRYSYESFSQSLRYFNTGVNFVYDALQVLELRINFRMNLWTATLDTVPLFSDLPFYTGPNARNLGSLLIQCRPSSLFAPGSNYLLFDDLTVRAEPPPALLPPEILYTAGSGARLSWFQEAGYTYEIRYSDDLTLWNPGLPGAISVATATGFTGALTDSVSNLSRRFYRLSRALPP